MIRIYDLQKKAKKFKWRDEAEKAFNKIKKLLISPAVLKAPTPDGLFQLKVILQEKVWVVPYCKPKEMNG